MSTIQTKGYPKGFTEYQILFRRKIYPGAMGLHPNTKRPTIFANRLRVARQFDGLKLLGYTENTEAGYEGLMRVFLAYTALEKLGDVLLAPSSRKSIGRIALRDKCSLYAHDSVLKSLNVNDPKGRFVEHVAKHCKSSQLKARIGGLLSEDPPSIAILANGIRNLFAHGHLTPSPQNCDPTCVAKLCEQISRFVIHVLDEEFSSVIVRYCEKSGIDYESLAKSSS